MARRSTRTALLVFLLAAVASPGHAAVIRSLTVTGNSAFAAREILSWLSSQPGLRYSGSVLRNDLAAIEDHYRARGFLAGHAEVADSLLTSDSAGITLTIRIDEGRPSILGSLRLRGTPSIPADAAQEFEVRPGEPLNPELLERDFDALLARYERLGRPFARCAIDSMTTHPGPSEDTLDILVGVDEGPRVTIDQVRVQGNRETRADVVTREARIVPGEIFNPVKVEAIRRRLTRLNIFSSVEEPDLYMREGHGGLLLRVREGSFNTFDGVLGYVPASVPGQSGFFTGLASISMRNLFGTGRKFSIRWQREDQRSQEFTLRYLEPWLFGQPLNVGGGFLQRQQDTSYVDRTLDARIELMASEDLTAALSLRSERVIPSTDSTFVSPVPASSTVAVGADLQYDTRSDPISPSSGARYRMEYSYGHKKASPSAVTGTGGGPSAVQRLLLDVELYVRVIGRQVAALGLHGYDVRGGDVGESDMFRFGGTTTLRGYRENQFLGARVAWTNAEYRFLLGRRSFFFLFFDTGYYSRPADDIRNQAAAEAFKYGYGIGVRVDTAIGNIGVSFALGQGDSFSTAKIHVGIINDF